MFGRKKKNTAQVLQGQNDSAVTLESDQSLMSDDTLIAVITAAVALSLGTSSNGIVIKSIRRTGQIAPVWGVRGRIEQVFNRL